MDFYPVLSQSSVTDLAKSTRDIASESIVLATLFLACFAAFVLLRYGAYPVAKVVLETVSKLAVLQESMKEHNNKLQATIEQLMEHRCDPASKITSRSNK